ncbi:MAG: serine/threonine protein kinase [Acidobacteria bacterium]|nr:serine/threonine protein kinase [Acidobacteriota bacterium]
MKKDGFHDREQLSPEADSVSEPQSSSIPKPPSILVHFNPSVLVGQTLDGRFLIIRDLSENDAADKGGIGLVYLAQDLKLLGKRVVIKILREASLKNADLARKFQHEREALIRLDHPNVVRILDSGVLSDGNPYMVMDYIDGYSLRRVLTENKELSFEFCAHIIESITEALSAAHSKKILHRDIKPENIMLTPQEEGAEHIRLIDFGIARVGDSALAPATQIERGIGTILYIAPEQLLGQLDQTPSVDIYACAIVAYEMLTGKLPFSPHTIVEMFELQRQGIKTQPRDVRPEISEEAERILLQALAFDPADRPQDVRVFGRSLTNALRHAGDTKQHYISDQKNENDDLVGKTNSQSGRKTNSQSGEKNANLFISPGIKAKTIDPTQPSVDSNKIIHSITDLPKKYGNKPKQSKTLIWFGLGILVLAVVSSLVGLVWWKNSENTAANNNISNANIAANLNNEKVSDAPRREISYHLNVQKMRDGKPYEKPFRSSGREIFESGYKFKMVLESDADGYLYLYNEGKNKKGEIEYYLLHPILRQKESAQVKANQEIETGYNFFSGGKGTEILWIIWTKQGNNVLEAAKQSALETQGGVVSDEEIARQLDGFLQRGKKTEADKDTANQQTIVEGEGDVVIHRLELEHR